MDDAAQIFERKRKKCRKISKKSSLLEMEVKCRFLRSYRSKRTDFSFLQDLILEILDHEEQIHDNCVRSEKFELIENCVEEVPEILLTKKLKNSDKGFFSVNTNKSEI